MDGRIGGGVARLWVLGTLSVVFLLAAAAPRARADIGTEINALPTLDALNRSENPLAGGGNWTKLNWATTAGSDSAAGWIPASGFPTVNGAYWTPTILNDSSGEAAALTMAAVPGISERYVSLWLDMANPGAAKSGYQLRWTVETSGSTYALKLSKWTAGEEAVLATKAGVTIAAGSPLALVDSGSGVSVWQGSSGTFSQLLTATDSTYSSGYAGIEGSGSNSRSTNFKAGTLAPPPPPPETTIGAGPKGDVVPNVSFSFSGTNSPTGFECSLDGGAFAACASPKSYSGLGEGSHAFRVRGVNGSGADATPAEQSFRVLTAAKAVSKVRILDSFERSEVPLATGKFTKPLWASAIGGTWMGTYRGYGSSGSLAGAYWNQGTFGDGGEATVLASGVVGTGATPVGQYLALWLDMPDPATARSGYEARFSGGGSATSYTAELAKWAAGTRTVLATASGVSLPVGTTMALTETAGGSLALWTGTSSLTPLLSATASDYSGGYAGLEVNGGAGTIYNFRAGRIDLTAPETTITSGPSGPVVPAAASFAFSASEAGSSFECALDTAFSLCTSPKSYSTATAGPHVFKVRALDAVGNQDETPAERSFTIVPPPTVATTAASGVTTNQANLKGTVNPNGDATTYQFEYGTTTAYGSKVPASPKAIGSGTAAVEATEAISGLTAATTYHYRLLASNGAGTSKGEDKTFTTAAAPTATTEAASGVMADRATLNATINPRGAATTYYFEYGPTTAYGSKVPLTAKSAGSAYGDASFSETLTGLNEAAEYHYRVVATNSGGTVNGVDKTFKTLQLPTVTTGAVEAVEDTEALLTGSIEPHGQKASYQFEYGTTSSYGVTVPSAEEEFGGQTPTVTASEVAAELQPETTYHYRLIATSAAGTQVGADRTFATAAAAPPPPTTILPNDFYGLVNSGEIPQTAELEEMNYLGHSGARMFRLLLHESLPETSIEQIFSQAADRGVRVLPYFQVPWEENATQNAYIEKEVAKYGPNGSFWGPGGGYAGAHPQPVTWWEVGNEPNLGKNTSNRSTPYDEANWDKVKKIGNWFAAYAGAARAGAAKRGATIKVLLSGLFTTRPTSCYQMPEGGATVTECEVSAVDFITHMGHETSYNAVSLHPYAFKVEGGEAPKNTKTETDELIAKVRSNVKKVRAALTGVNAGKGIWVTELGFPVHSDNQATFPSVTEPTQATLIKKAMENLANEHDELGIEHLFIWNLRDKNAPSWEWNDGLRRADGTLRREAWNAFKSEAGENLNWPVHPDAKAFAEKIKEGSHAADASSKINPHGLRTIYWAKYGQGPITNSWGSFTAAQSAGAGEAEVQGTNTLSGLQPNTIYHYRIVAENSNGEKEESADRQFSTPPSSSTSIRQVRILHGQPGYAWFEGWVKEGFIEGPGPGLGNVHVHINLYRDGSSQPERFIDVMTNGEGHYSSGYFPIGKSSTWVAKAEFPGGGPWAQSISGPEPFAVRDGVRIRAQHSGGCWDIFGAQQQNGAAVMHGACNEPPSSNQVFELVPQEGGSYLNIVARNSGRCVDVVNGSYADGSGLQQYDCLGAGQANQLFREAWSGNWLSYVAKHSQKCVDVTGANPGWTNLQQWTCNASPQQAYRLEPVESGPKPTETFITTDHLIHGNGQWGNNWGKISASGHLLAGAWSMANRVVQVEFEKLVGGSYQRTDNRAVTVNPDGSYQLLDYALAPGIWRVRAEFIGNGEYQGSASGWHDFSIFQANRLVARHSGKCLSLSENRNVNGQHLIQWDCAGTGSMGDGQTFWFWPVPGYGPHVYEITVISSGKCLDIANGSQANGGVLQQWDCNGYGQQLWELLELAGQPGYYALRPLHSHKCLDVAGASTANGAEVWQWDCHWGGNQQWILYGVVGG